MVEIDHSDSRWIECRVPTTCGVVTARFTTRNAGDFSANQPVDELANNRRDACPHGVSWLHQVHSAVAFVVRQPTQHQGRQGDSLVCTIANAAAAVQTADCVPVLLVADDGIFGVVHAGWRGALAGVVDTSMAIMRSATMRPFTAIIGPCIHARQYEFGDGDLRRMVDSFGSEVESTTAWGSPSLDMVAVVRRALARSGVDMVVDLDICTGEDMRFFSFRCRADAARQALIAWRSDDE